MPTARADRAVKMRAILARHPHVSLLRPGEAGVAQHMATWIEVSADPRIDGTPVTLSRDSLSLLATYLEARLG
jgi:hypothetical protein